MTRYHFALWILRVLALLVSSVIPCLNHASCKTLDSKTVAIDNMRLVIDKKLTPGFRLTNGAACYVASADSDFRPAAKYIVLREGKWMVLVHSLDQFKGLCAIGSMSDAISFVRLRTAEEYQPIWKSTGHPVFEIISRSQLSQPGYRGTGYSGLAKSESKSGFDGIMSDHDYSIFPNQPLTCTHFSDGYVIQRWVVVLDMGSEPERYALQYWRETVNNDGGYKLQVLKRATPARLPETSWGTYRLK